VFIALDVPTRFWINFELGSRTNHTAGRLVLQLKAFGKWTGSVVKITTDKLAAYKNALTKHFEDVSYHYLQIVKKRYKRRLVTVKKEFVKGTENNFPKGTQNTSFIERFNLTLRQHVSSLTRKTLGYCKKKTHFQYNLWINLYNYNYIQVHKSLRVKITERHKKFKKRYKHNTPAMKMGLTREALNWRYLLTIPIIPTDLFIIPALVCRDYRFASVDLPHCRGPSKAVIGKVFNESLSSVASRLWMYICIL